MKTINTKTCPFCGGQDMLECILDSGGPVYLTPDGARSDTLFATVCRSCGNVLTTYYKTPDEFYPVKKQQAKKNKPHKRRYY